MYKKEQGSLNWYTFGFNGMEKDDEVTGVTGSHLDFGARMYDSRIGRFIKTDPLMNHNGAWSPYSFGLDNPIVYIDENGEWPGITFMFFHVEGGLGIVGGFNYIYQSGIASDQVGKTHFRLTSAIYVVNQDLPANADRTPDNPQVIIGADAGTSVGGGIKWGWDTWYEYAYDNNVCTYGGPMPVGKFKLKAKAGAGFDISEDEFALNFGLTIGLKFSRLSTFIERSISVSDDEAEAISKMEGVLPQWSVKDIEELKNQDGDIIGYRGILRTTQGNSEKDTGINVFSGISKEDGKIMPNDIWFSMDYARAALKRMKDRKSEDNSKK